MCVLIAPACVPYLDVHAAASEPLIFTFQLADVGLVKDYQTGEGHMQKRLRITGGCYKAGQPLA
jgi:hypothetical protein